MAKITIIGAGGFGLALAINFNKYKHSVCVYEKFDFVVDEINKTRKNELKLPGVDIPPEIVVTNDIKVCDNANIIIFSVPTFCLRESLIDVKPYINPQTILVNTSKGLDSQTYVRMSEIMNEIIPENKSVVLSGPSHAEEVARFIPTAVVAASTCKEAAVKVQKELSNELFRIYYNDDVVGCELGGALKNIIAVAAGICDGLKCGDNTKAALMTRGITEIARLGMALGAKQATFAGLTGIGDLIVTCTSMHSRNHRAGILIGSGVSPTDAVKQIGTVEGFNCTKAAYALSKQTGVSMPIVEQCYNILFEGQKPLDAVYALMERPAKPEVEETFI
ncbi:MAG: NAD(P)-dependent glycerol-3-phosphate dehydrogenase [Ruminococcus sp.]|nr:NAD(P)-dependent glycerol-3-phosphate dehydrogenase [Ruminococcus sp.]